MIELKTPADIETMQANGAIVVDCFKLALRSTLRNRMG